MLAYPEWDKEIKNIFAPLINTGIRVRSLPRTVFNTTESEDDVTWMFPDWQTINFLAGGVCVFEVALVFQLYLSERYDIPNTSQSSIEFVENWILDQFSHRVLPLTASRLKPVSRKLFAPDRGRWYAELRFTFEARGSSSFDQMGTVVEQITAKQGGSDLWVLQ